MSETSEELSQRIFSNLTKTEESLERILCLLNPQHGKPQIEAKQLPLPTDKMPVFPTITPLKVEKIRKYNVV